MLKTVIIKLFLITFFCCMILFSGCTERSLDENITITYNVNKESSKIPFSNIKISIYHDYNVSVNVMNEGQSSANNVIINVTLLKSSKIFNDPIVHEEFIGTLLPSEQRNFYVEFNAIQDDKPTFSVSATSDSQI